MSQLNVLKAIIHVKMWQDNVHASTLDAQSLLQET